MNPLVIFSTDFRDGAQGEECQITDLNLALKAIFAIDRHGVAYHELGFSVGNPITQSLIAEAKKLSLQGKIAAFCRTQKDDVSAVLALQVPVAVVVGKTRKSDAEKIIRQGADKNLELIRDSVRHLYDAGIEVIYDAEHYFDAVHGGDRAYALQTIRTAFEAGAKYIVLCDTNGGMRLNALKLGISIASQFIPIEWLGIHCHDDRGRGVCLVETAYEIGIRHIQGTFGGHGERCGNSNLVTLLPNLQVDYELQIPNLDKLTETYESVCRALNIEPNPKQPWVGRSAGYTSAGMHQSGLGRDPMNYLHADLTKVGNKPRVGLTIQSGRANVLAKARELGIEIPDAEIQRVSDCVFVAIGAGYDFSYEATFKLFLLRLLGHFTDFITHVWYEVRTRTEGEKTTTLADLHCTINARRMLHNSDGDGPVNALDKVLRRTVKHEHPKLLSVRLTAYHVDVFNVAEGTAAKVRVYCRWTDDSSNTWATMASDTNIVHASWLAILDGYSFKYQMNGDQPTVVSR